MNICWHHLNFTNKWFFWKSEMDWTRQREKTTERKHSRCLQLMPWLRSAYLRIIGEHSRLPLWGIGHFHHWLHLLRLERPGEGPAVWPGDLQHRHLIISYKLCVEKNQPCQRFFYVSRQCSDKRGKSWFSETASFWNSHGAKCKCLKREKQIERNLLLRLNIHFMLFQLI